MNNPKEYNTPNFSEIDDPKTLRLAKSLVKKVKVDGGIVFHVSGEGHSITYAEDKDSMEYPGDDAISDGFITVVYAKDFF